MYTVVALFHIAGCAVATVALATLSSSPQQPVGFSNSFS
jgi:hypothetical protein